VFSFSSDHISLRLHHDRIQISSYPLLNLEYNKA
jgi:hypothetical protein